MNLIRSVALICIADGLLALTCTAAAPWKTAEGYSTDWDRLAFTEQALRGDLHLLHASGGNIVALTAREGTLLVNDEGAQLAQALKSRLSGMQAGPVRYVISTDFHPENAGANGAFVKEGAVVIAQATCRAELLTSHFNGYWKTHVPAVAEADAPSVTFDRNMTLYFAGETVDLVHTAPAHTGGDTVVFFRKANVVAMGDIYVNGLYPEIDILSKGSIDGYIAVIDAVLDQINDATLVVPGHGPVASRSDLKDYRYMLKTVRDRVAAAVSSQKRLETIIYDNPSYEYDAKWASDRVGPEGFTALVYQSLTHKRLDWSPSTK